VIERVAALGWPRNTLLNINIPNIAADQVRGIVAASQGRRKIGDNIVESLDPRGRHYYWIGPTRDEDVAKVGTDIHEVTTGAVAVTPIYLDLTHHAALAELRRLLEPDRTGL
jgi:5'-nucleotidase